MSHNYWRPTSSFTILKLRARVLRQIRDFFFKRNILEVETPLLAESSILEPTVRSFTTELCDAPDKTLAQKLYLQTSPEFAMKRLLAAGSGDIYQICKSFRNLRLP